MGFLSPQDYLLASLGFSSTHMLTLMKPSSKQLNRGCECFFKSQAAKGQEPCFCFHPLTHLQLELCRVTSLSIYYRWQGIFLWGETCGYGLLEAEEGFEHWLPTSWASALTAGLFYKWWRVALYPLLPKLKIKRARASSWAQSCQYVLREYT